jgi:hypothetical protein
MPGSNAGLFFALPHDRPKVEKRPVFLGFFFVSATRSKAPSEALAGEGLHTYRGRRWNLRNDPALNHAHGRRLFGA